MTKDQLTEMAKIGVRERLRATEAELGQWFKEFPDLFLGDTAPQLLRPEMRTNGNGAHAWPIAVRKGSRSAQLLPYLIEHGPSKIKPIAQALGLSGSGALSSAIAILLREGKIERQGHGTYAATNVATAQPDEPTAGKRRRRLSKITVRRQHTAALLAQIAKAGKPLTGAEIHALTNNKVNGIGPLVRRGYLRNTKRGFVRTKKEFVIA